MALLRVGRDTEDGTTSIVDPVRGEETAEGRDESDTTVVLDRLGEGAELGRVLDEAEVVDEELDTGTGDGDAALEGVHAPASTKVEGDGAQKTVGGDDGLGTDVVQQEAASTVGVLGETGSEALLADEGGRLVTEAAHDLGALEGTLVERAVGLGVGRGDNLGEEDLLAVNAEPVNEIVVVVESLNVHEHGTRGVGRVRDVDIVGASTVELVGQPGVDGTESEVALVVSILDGLDILEQPEKLAGGRVGGQRQTAALGQLAGTEAALEAADELLGASVCPDNGVVEGLAGGLVPDDGGLTLVGDADGLDLVARVALGLKGLDCAVDASGDGGDELLRVMLVPSVVSMSVCAFPLFICDWAMSAHCVTTQESPPRHVILCDGLCVCAQAQTQWRGSSHSPWLGVDLLELELVRRDNLTADVEDEEARRGSALVNGSDESRV